MYVSYKWNSIKWGFCDWLLLLCLMYSEFIHLVACISTSVYYTWYIHSSVNRHLDCFPLLTMVNTAARNSHVQVHAQVWTHIFNSLGTESLGHAEALSLICSGATRLFSKVSMSFYIPTSSVWGLRFPPILTNTCSYPSFTIKNIPMNVKWYVLLWFWFSFSWWPKMSKIFLCAYWPFVYLLQRNVSSDPSPI